MQYPWEAPITAKVARADLDYYVRAATRGPSMTDAVSMIDTASSASPLLRLCLHPPQLRTVHQRRLQPVSPRPAKAARSPS